MVSDFGLEAKILSVGLSLEPLHLALNLAAQGPGPGLEKMSLESKPGNLCELLKTIITFIVAQVMVLDFGLEAKILSLGLSLEPLHLALNLAAQTSLVSKPGNLCVLLKTIVTFP